MTTHFLKAEVDAGFLKGGVLHNAGVYQVHTARRENPGKVEVHALETDIFHMLEGEATLVTGGTVLDPVTVEPHEIRGTQINGGESRHLRPGDIVVIPHGEPHWFKDVKAPVIYLAIKIRK